MQWQRTIIPIFARLEDKPSAPIRSNAPESTIPKTLITPALAAHLVIDKHCDHLPHYRQSQRLFREHTAEISHKGYIWVMRNPKNRATYYHWGARRNAGALMDLLGYHEVSKKLEFEGTLQCDGYTCYETLANAYQSIQLGLIYAGNF